MKIRNKAKYTYNFIIDLTFKNDLINWKKGKKLNNEYHNISL